METAQKSQIKPSRISPPCPKSRKHLYAEYMAYTVYQKDCTLPDIWIDKERQIESVDILGQVFSEQWNQLMMCLHCFLKRKKYVKNKTCKRLPIIDYCKRWYFRVINFSRFAAQKHIRGLLNSRWADAHLSLLYCTINIIQWMIHLQVCM